MQFSTTLRNNRLDAVASTVGASAILQIRSGAAPANCGAADSGTVLATLNLPSTWMGSASGGVVDLTGTWEDQSADATGTAGHFRLYASNGTTCHIQGTVGTSAADLVVDNTSFATGQKFTITRFELTEGNA